MLEDSEHLPTEEDMLDLLSSEPSPEEAVFPLWVPLSSDNGASAPPKDLICLMTEIQLQAILDNQVGQDGELDVDMTTNKKGEKISKFDIQAISLGDDVTPCLLYTSPSPRD